MDSKQGKRESQMKGRTKSSIPGRVKSSIPGRVRRVSASTTRLRAAA